MKKSSKILLLVITIMSIFMVMTISSSALTSGDFRYEILDDGTVEIIQYTGSASELEIPSKIDGYTVTKIGNCGEVRYGVANVWGAFCFCDTLISVVIPDTITAIGDWAFEGCSLTKINIPNSVTSIGDYAFFRCNSLASIDIPNSVTTIGNSAFADCNSLASINVNWGNEYYSSVLGVLYDKAKTELIQYPAGKTDINYVIPDGITSIGGDAFYDCDSLQSITIPDSVKTISEYAFYNCTSLTDIYYMGSENQWNNVVISYGNDVLNNVIIHYNANGHIESDWIIDEDATCISYGSKHKECLDCGEVLETEVIFATGHNFNSADICENCGEYVWQYEINNGEVTLTYYIGNEIEVVIPNEIEGYPVTVIGSYTFDYNTTMQMVVIPDSVKTISEFAFAYCDNLQEVVIGNGVTIIESYAFEGCISLETITIPKNVIIIGNDAFAHSNLNTINGYKGTFAETFASTKGFNFVALSDIPVDYTGLYKVDGVWRYVKNGELDNTYTGLCKYNGKWYYVNKGVVDKTYTGLCKYNSKWYYVNKGVVDKSYTGLCKRNGVWYYVKKGVVDFSYTGLCKRGTKWYYVDDGKVNFKYTGLCKYSGKWYYVEDGVVDKTYTGLCKHSGKWYYVKKGVVDFTYTGLCKRSGKWYYVNKGKVDFTYTGYTTYNGKKYKVVKGVKV